MLYGYGLALDGKTTTLVIAADTVEEYDSWVADVMLKPENCTECEVSTFADLMLRSEFKGFKRPIVVVSHTSIEQRDAFNTAWDIKQVKLEQARDRQQDMIWLKKQQDKAKLEEQALEEGRDIGQSLEEIHNLVNEDRWDKRTEEQKAHDDEFKKKMKEAQKRGDISSDSFGDAKTQREARAKERSKAKGEPTKDDVHVSDIRVSEKDGQVHIDSVIAHKHDSEVDKDQAAANIAAREESISVRKKGKRVFSPEDFAAVLAGDGSADHLNIPPDPGGNKNRREPASKDLNLSDLAATARREFQAGQKRDAEVKAAQQREEDDILAKQEHEEGIIRGCDLLPDQTINHDELSEAIKELLSDSGIKQDTYPLKDYPYNSKIGDKVLLPSDGLMTPRRIRLVGSDNLSIIASISMIEPTVVIAAKIDEALVAWAVYAREKVQDDPNTKRSFEVYIVRIR